MPIIPLLIICTPIALVIWLVSRVIQSGQRIEEITKRVGDLEAQLGSLKKTDQTSRPIPELEPISHKPVVPAPFVPPPLPRVEPQPIPSAPRKTPPLPAKEKESFEMRIGTYWLVRVGIVMLLTGLVFFGNYAYQNFVTDLGAAGKVGLLYLAGALLLAAGAWWQRTAEKPSMRNYAQVLFAGGLAMVYFTTYAAHHIAQLRIIQSAVLDGILLLVWASFMAWIADRKKSEVLALFAVGLAYYTSVITRVGSFTLCSNLILTLIAVVFLVRNRWVLLSLASLVATYFGYAFWRFFDEGQWRWAGPNEGLWFGAYFLISYWLLFTLSAFLSKHENSADSKRAGFVTLNNSAFFLLFVLTMVQVQSGGFWKFSMIYGACLLALSDVSQRFYPAEPFTKNAYLSQGLLLMTVGFISKFTGYQLALVLAVESVILLLMSLQRRSSVLKISAYIVAALSILWGIDGLERFDVRGLWLGSALTGLMIFNAGWARPQNGNAHVTTLSAGAAYFSILAVLMMMATTWFNTSRDHYPLVLAVEAVVLTLSIYVLRIRELTQVGQMPLLTAYGVSYFKFLEYGLPLWWNPAALVVVTFGLGHWWQTQKVMDPSPVLARAYRWIALAASLWWIYEYVPTREHLWILALTGFAVFAFAGWRRNREALWFGAVFSAAATLLFWTRCLSPELIYWPNGVALFVLLGQQQIAQRLPSRYNVKARTHALAILIGGITLWLFVSRWILRSASGFYLTTGWSGLALILFAFGIILRERMYRWLGLGALAAALGRIMLFDVWKLETVYRMLSFMALGVVLLALGFVYNKYQEKIRKWL